MCSISFPIEIITTFFIECKIIIVMKFVFEGRRTGCCALVRFVCISLFFFIPLLDYWQPLKSLDIWFTNNMPDIQQYTMHILAHLILLFLVLIHMEMWQTVLVPSTYRFYLVSLHCPKWLYIWAKAVKYSYQSSFHHLLLR